MLWLVQGSHCLSGGACCPAQISFTRYPEWGLRAVISSSLFCFCLLVIWKDSPAEGNHYSGGLRNITCVTPSHHTHRNTRTQTHRPRPQPRRQWLVDTATEGWPLCSQSYSMCYNSTTRGSLKPHSRWAHSLLSSFSLSPFCFSHLPAPESMSSISHLHKNSHFSLCFQKPRPMSFPFWSFGCLAEYIDDQLAPWTPELE